MSFVGFDDTSSGESGTSPDAPPIDYSFDDSYFDQAQGGAPSNSHDDSTTSFGTPDYGQTDSGPSDSTTSFGQTDETQKKKNATTDFGNPDPTTPGLTSDYQSYSPPDSTTSYGSPDAGGYSDYVSPVDYNDYYGAGDEPGPYPPIFEMEAGAQQRGQQQDFTDLTAGLPKGPNPNLFDPNAPLDPSQVTDMRGQFFVGPRQPGAPSSGGGGLSFADTGSGDTGPFNLADAQYGSDLQTPDQRQNATTTFGKPEYTNRAELNVPNSGETPDESKQVSDAYLPIFETQYQVSNEARQMSDSLNGEWDNLDKRWQDYADAVNNGTQDRDPQFEASMDGEQRDLQARTDAFKNRPDSYYDDRFTPLQQNLDTVRGQVNDAIQGRANTSALNDMAGYDQAGEYKQNDAINQATRDALVNLDATALSPQQRLQQPGQDELAKVQQQYGTIDNPRAYYQVQGADGIYAGQWIPVGNDPQQLAEVQQRANLAKNDPQNIRVVSASTFGVAGPPDATTVPTTHVEDLGNIAKVAGVASLVALPFAIVGAGAIPAIPAGIGITGSLGIVAGSYLLKGTGEHLGDTVHGGFGGVLDLVGGATGLTKVTDAIKNMPIPEAAQNPLSTIEQMGQYILENPGRRLNPVYLAADIYKNGIAEGGLKQAYNQNDEQFALSSGLQKAGLEYLATSAVQFNIGLAKDTVNDVLSGRRPSAGIGDFIRIANPVGDYTNIFRGNITSGMTPEQASQDAFTRTNNGVASVIRTLDLFNPLMYAVEVPFFEDAVRGIFKVAGIGVRGFLESGATGAVGDIAQGALGNTINPRGAFVATRAGLDLFTTLSTTSAVNIANEAISKEMFTQIGRIGEKNGALADLYEMYLYKSNPEVWAQRIADYSNTYLKGQDATTKALSERLGNGFTARMVEGGAKPDAIPGMIETFANTLRSGDWASTPELRAASDATTRKYVIRPAEIAKRNDYTAFELAKADVLASLMRQAGLPVIPDRNAAMSLLQAGANSLRSLYLLPGASALAIKKIGDEFIRGGLTGVWGLRPADFQLVRTGASRLIERGGALGAIGQRIEDRSAVRIAMATGTPLDDYLLRTPVSRYNLGDAFGRNPIDNTGRKVTAAGRLEALFGAPGRFADKYLQTLVSSPTQHLRLSGAYRELKDVPAIVRSFADDTMTGLVRDRGLPQNLADLIRTDLARATNQQDYYEIAQGIRLMDRATSQPNVPANAYAKGRAVAPIEQQPQRLQDAIRATGGREQGLVKEATTPPRTRGPKTYEEYAAQGGTPAALDKRNPPLKGDAGSEMPAAVRATYDRAKAEMPGYLKDVQAVSDLTGGRYPQELTQFALKSEPSVLEKLGNNGGQVPTDLLRFTIEHPDPASVYPEVIDAMRARGYELRTDPATGRADITNRYDSTSPYKDVALKFVKGADDPVVKELQIVSPEMLDAKMGAGHLTYDVEKVIRALSGKGVPADVHRELRTRIDAVANKIYGDALAEETARRSGRASSRPTLANVEKSSSVNSSPRAASSAASDSMSVPNTSRDANPASLSANLDLDAKSTAANVKAPSVVPADTPIISRRTIAGPYGRDAAVTFENGETHPVRYRVVDASELAVNHPDVQPRNRATGVSEQQVDRIARNFDPARVLNESTAAGEAPPIITSDGKVLSGNGRMSAMLRLDDASYARYRDMLLRDADHYGLDPAELKEFDAKERPILVREVTEPLDTVQDARRFADRANAANTLARDTTETTTSDLRHMTPDVIGSFKATDTNGLAAAVNQNDDAVVRFIRSIQREDPNAAAALVDGRGVPRQVAYDRFENALVGAAYGDAAAVATRVLEERGAEFATIGNALRDAAPQMARVAQGAPEAALGKDLQWAMDVLPSVKAAGGVDNYLANGALFGDPGRTAEGEDLLRVLWNNRNSKTALTNDLRAYAKLVTPNDTAAGSFFPDMNRVRTKAEALAEMARPGAAVTPLSAGGAPLTEAAGGGMDMRALTRTQRSGARRFGLENPGDLNTLEAGMGGQFDRTRFMAREFRPGVSDDLRAAYRPDARGAARANVDAVIRQARTQFESAFRTGDLNTLQQVEEGLLDHGQAAIASGNDRAYTALHDARVRMFGPATETKEGRAAAWDAARQQAAATAASAPKPRPEIPPAGSARAPIQTSPRAAGAINRGMAQQERDTAMLAAYDPTVIQSRPPFLGTERGATAGAAPGTGAGSTTGNAGGLPPFMRGPGYPRMPQPPTGNPDYQGAADDIEKQGRLFAQMQLGRGNAALERGNAIVGNFRQQTPIGELMTQGTINGRGPNIALVPFAPFHIHTTQYWAEYFLQHPQAAYAIANALNQYNFDEYGGKQMDGQYVSGMLDMSTAAHLIHWAQGIFQYARDVAAAPGNNPLQKAAKIGGQALFGNEAYVRPFDYVATPAQAALQSVTNPLIQRDKNGQPKIDPETGKPMVDKREQIAEQGSATGPTAALQYLNDKVDVGQPWVQTRNIISGVSNPGQQITNKIRSAAVNAVDRLGGNADLSGYDAAKQLPYFAGDYAQRHNLDPATVQRALYAPSSKEDERLGSQIRFEYARQQDQNAIGKLLPVHASEETNAKGIFPPFDKNGPVSYSPGGASGRPDFYINRAEWAGSKGAQIESDKTALAMLKSDNPDVRASAEAYLNANQDKAFNYQRNAGTGGRDLGTGVPAGTYTDKNGVPNGYYVESPDQSRYNTARADIAKANPVTPDAIPYMDYNRDYLQNPDIAAMGTANQQSSLAGEIAGNVSRTGATLPPDQRAAQIAKEQTLQVQIGTNPDGSPFTAANLFGQPGNIYSIEKEYADAKKAGASKETLAAIGKRIDDAKAKDLAQFPGTQAYFDQADAAQQAKQTGPDTFYGGLTPAEKNAYDAFNDLRSSADYKRYQELEAADRAAGAYGTPGEKAWYSQNKDELNRLKGVVATAEQSIQDRFGVNPKELANRSSVAAGRSPVYADTTLTKQPGSSSTTSGSATSTSSTAGLSPAEQQALDSFNTLRDSTEYKRYQELQNQERAAGAYGTPGEKAWYEKNKTELNNLKDFVEGTEAAITQKFGANPKEAANKVAVAAGRQPTYADTTIKGATSATSATGATSAGADSVRGQIVAKAMEAIGTDDFANFCEQYVEQAVEAITGRRGATGQREPSASAGFSHAQAMGLEIPENEAQVGDLVYYPDAAGGVGHVAVYMGNGQQVSTLDVGGSKVHVEGILSGARFVKVPGLPDAPDGVALPASYAWAANASSGYSGSSSSRSSGSSASSASSGKSGQTASSGNAGNDFYNLYRTITDKAEKATVLSALDRAGVNPIGQKGVSDQTFQRAIDVTSNALGQKRSPAASSGSAPSSTGYTPGTYTPGTYTPSAKPSAGGVTYRGDNGALSDAQILAGVPQQIARQIAAGQIPAGLIQRAIANASGQAGTSRYATDLASRYGTASTGTASTTSAKSTTAAAASNVPKGYFLGRDGKLHKSNYA